MAATLISSHAGLTNGVSFGISHVVTSTDVTNTAILFDFGLDYTIVGSIQVVTSANVNVPLADAVITYPAAGQIEITKGAATFNFVAGQIIYIVVQRLGAVV